MNWKVAPSLVKLRDQLNAAHPNRSKASDGTIGDAKHAASKSEHNPDSKGIVRAFDITHDPAHGVNGNQLAAQLIASRDPRILYVIWNRRIARSYAKPGIPAWSWSTYTGEDPHTNHVHLSVVPDARANSVALWRITGPATPNTEETELMAIHVKNPSTGAPWNLDDALWSIWTYGIRAARDAGVARALAEAQAKAGRALTVNEIDDIAKAVVDALPSEAEQ